MRFPVWKLFLSLSLSCYLFHVGGGVSTGAASSSELDIALSSVKTSGSLVGLLLEESKTRMLASIIDNLDNLRPNDTVSLRALAEGDFDSFNSLFQDVIINLPPTTVTQQVLFKLTLDLKEIYCTNVNVSDVLITYNRESDQRFTFQVDVIDLAMDCFIEYDYNYVVSGSGNAKAVTDNNQASILFVLGSTDFDEAPPTSSTVENCAADINLNSLELGGDWASQILDVFKGLLTGTVENQVQTLACNELSSLGNDFVNDALVLISDRLTPYLGLVQAVDPLAAETNLQVPNGTNLLDFSDKDSMIGGWLDMALQEADTLLGTEVDDEGGPTGTGRDLGVNVFLRDFVLDDDRALVVDVANLPLENNGILYEGHDMLTETTITLDRVTIFGLDTFTKFEPLVLIGKHTFQNALVWDYLALELDVTIDMKASSKEESIISIADGASPTLVEETVKISVGVDQLEAVISILLAVDENALGSLSLGRLLDTSNLPSCLLSLVHAVELSEMSVSVGNIREPTLEGFVSPGIDRLVTRGVEALFLMYEKLLLDAAPNVASTLLKNMVNSELLSQFNGDNADCPILDTKGGFINFHDLLLKPQDAAVSGGSGKEPYGDLIPTLMTLLREQFLAPGDDGLPIANSKLIRQFAKDGSLVFGDLFDSGTRVQVGGLDAQVALKAYNARIENMDSMGEPLSVLEPVPDEPYLLNNTVSLGVGPMPLRLGLTFLISLLGDDDMKIRNEVDISLDLETATVAIAALLKIAEERFVSFPMQDITNLNCWLSTIPAPPLDSRGLRLGDAEPTASLQQIAAAVARMNLNVTCISCTSPAMEELAVLLSSEEGTEDFTGVANKILDFATDLLGGNFLQTTIDRLLNEAPKSCPHRPEYQLEPVKTIYEPLEAVDNSSGSIQFLVTLMVVVGIIILMVIMVSFVVRRIVRRRNEKWLRSLPGYSISFMITRQNLKNAKDAEINRMTTSMFTSSDIPLFVRLVMPFVILGNIGLFLSGHLSDGATVNIVAEFGGQGFTVDKFFEFTMARSTIDIWNAGGKELAILIGIFSGVWPYTKQLISLALWFLPPRFVTVQRRGSIFLWLDTLGKWSMVDIFVLVVSIAAFQVNIESPDVAFLPEGFYSISLFVIPLWGLYANMIAQLVSQVSSHFIIHYHRRIADNASVACDRILGENPTTLTEHSDSSQSSEDQARNDNGVSRRVLRKHAFERPHRGEFDKVKVRRSVSPALVFVALVVTGLLIAGCIVPSLAVEVLGVLGVFVESGQEFNAAVTEFNVFNLVQLLFDEARFLDTPGDYLGLGVLGILFVATILVVPVLQTATLLRQWFGSLTEKQRNRMSVLTEILQAWQYVEVYLLALIVSAWQLGPISSFMINSYCDGFDDAFASMVYYGVLDPVDAQCFKVQAEIKSGTFILIAASLLLYVLHTFVVKSVHQYERDVALVSSAHQDAKLAESFGGLSREAYNDAIEKLEPSPVLFTDRFRWVMRREDSVVSTRTRRGLDDRAKLGVNEEFPDEPTELAIEMGEESSSYTSTPRQSFDLESDSSVLSTVLESTQLDAAMPLDMDDRMSDVEVFDLEDRSA